jgi:DNA (cytosine-5)-methyltransferase 1
VWSDERSAFKEPREITASKSSKPAMNNVIQLPSGGQLTSLELCAGGGGQALGLEAAGFSHAALVEIDRHAVATLRHNRPQWTVLKADLREFDASEYAGVDLLAGGLPCPPWSRAGKQHGENDERNLWPTALKIVGQVKPKAVMFENVRGILDAVFEDFRTRFASAPELEGYTTQWKLLNASDFGVPQLRPRVIFVAIRNQYANNWSWPKALNSPPTVGEALYDMMRAKGWRGAKKWKSLADEIAPTLVGGSLKHGGPDLGPTRARKEWATLGVDGLQLADAPPEKDFVGMPRLTVAMAARIQGFPPEWEFMGGKTASYRQVGNAFPPPVAAAVASSVRDCLIAPARRNADKSASFGTCRSNPRCKPLRVEG